MELCAPRRDVRWTWPRRPLVMAVVNATPDSVSDAAGTARGTRAWVEAGLRAVEAGADLVDVGGESGRTDVAAVGAEAEAERVLGVVGALAAQGVVVSVDTFRVEVAAAALGAGAAILNDVSGDPSAMAPLAAREGAALVVMHNDAPAKTAAFPGYDDPVEAVHEALRAGLDVTRAAGLDDAQVLLDPGPDWSKTPAETVAVLRGHAALTALGRPVLLALSRKFFLGALTGRRPDERGPATAAAFAWALARSAGHVLRAHDVAAARDVVDVVAALELDEDPSFRGDPDDEALKWLPSPT